MTWPQSTASLSTSVEDWPPNLDLPHGTLLDFDDTPLLDENDLVLVE